ncbi:hypothetical protein [Amycolatopsis pithecellobii]|uniref:Uncharacterized protein n=1 Tax=Amycolatopsis pithecellobii TaxID=664692 RepID=A0A6N7Z4X1_9PSEU|nr:hypothetical protein [Amycolatopsis pithecellobii]MTD55494.1 hypothetical protein [Amycolatopsis pithecellobii]
MLIKNASYIEAWAGEVRDAPLARTICDHPVVLRGADGTAVDLQWSGALETGRGAYRHRDPEGGFNVRLFHVVLEAQQSMLTRTRAERRETAAAKVGV